VADIALEVPLKLSSRSLNADTVNAIEYTQSWSIGQSATASDATTLYFQIVDQDRLDVTAASSQWDRFDTSSSPIRFIPTGTVNTVTVTFPNLDDSLVFSKTAYQPFALDGSIWAIDIASTDLPASGAVQFSLTMDGKTYMWSVGNFLTVDMVNAGMC
jgi:hypothetical protein